MSENITPRLKNVLKNAKKEAIKLGNDYVGTEHVVIAIIDADRGLAVDVLKRTSVPLDKIRAAIVKDISANKKDFIEISNNKELEECLVLAKGVSEQFKHTYVGTEHVLIAILGQVNPFYNTNGILKSLGIDVTGVRTQLLDELTNATKNTSSGDKVMAGGPKKTDEEKTSTNEPFIKKYAIDLTEKASKGEIDPVIGRTEEVKRVIHILSRKKKNNPVLVGPAGVGKTSIMEGLALRIYEKNVPKQLLTKRVFALDMPAIVAGTVYRGQFEERLKKILNEVKNNKDFIIFIDELHTVIGAGSAEGTMDASNILKPALARGEFCCAGATTLEEFRRYIEKDSALERRFQKVTVAEPNLKETVVILKGAAKSYETFHNVKYTDDVIEAAANLSNRFIVDRYQPDKGFDVLDEAGARVKLAYTGIGEDIKFLVAELAVNHMKRGEALEKADLPAAKKAKAEIERLEHQIAKAKLEDSQQSLTVKIEDINAVISSWTGIPVGDLGVTDKKNLISIGDSLKELVIGQDAAVDMVAKSLKKYRTLLKDPNRPMGSFLFLGPTGVGKSLLAKSLAKKAFGSEKAILELDMSEYADSIGVTKLIGASAGYVGYEDGAKLCKHVQQKPYSVILFDEIEKANPAVVELLLQILEYGRLTDNHGKLVDFKNTIIIMTSNLGVEAAKAMGFGNANDLNKRIKENMLVEVKKIFKPEFLNRLDVAIFDSMTMNNARKVVKLEVDVLNTKLSEENVVINLSPAAVEFILANGFNQKYGARNVRKQIETHIEDSLVDEFLQGKVAKNSVITFDVVDAKLTHKIKAKK